MRRVLCDMPIAAVSWGSGGFTVQQGGSLSLANVTLDGQITVSAGGSLLMNSVPLLAFACLTAKNGSSVVRPFVL